MPHFTSPEHRGPSDEQILSELLAQGEAGRPATEPIPQPGFGEQLRSTLFNPRGEPTEFLGGQNLLQRLGFTLGATGAGMQGQLPEFLSPFIQQQAGREARAQQSSQFQQELEAGFTRLEKEQSLARELSSLDRQTKLFTETGIAGPELHQWMQSSGLSADDIKTITKNKIELATLGKDLKKVELELAKAREKALKEGDATTRNILLGLQQPPTTEQAAMLKWFDKLPPETAKRLAPMVLGGMNAQQMLIYMGLLEGKSFSELVNLITSGDADPELTALTRIVTAFGAMQAGGIPMSEDDLRFLVGVKDKLRGKLKLSLPPSKAELLKEAQEDVKGGKALGVDDIIKKWQKANPGQMGRGAAGPRF